MDPDHVRLLLLVLGILLVAGIYLWDRYKRAAPRIRRSRRQPAVETFSANPAGGGADGERAEPQFHEVHEAADALLGEVLSEGRHDAAGGLDPEPQDIGEWSVASRDAEPQIAMDLNFGAHGDSDYLHTDPALYDEVERKIVVINLVSHSGGFSGTAIEKACAAVQLRLGEMSIFHYHDGASGRVLFSMASMLEPGTFPVDGMETFSTPGLALFTQLPGPGDGVAIFQAMLRTGKQLAQLLDGELQDERHNKLTRQMEDHIRESIIEHRRRINLARSRH